ncbi:maleate cis-trans isomerase [Pseudonocardia sp. EC080610-09]|uniref:maleate cis-trans isomerase family protein n=1 Tax=unclassified Pseudonocardia TaxID=2619320 RepID=UPI0006CB7502|nr:MULTISPECIES: maleate cis-trans isomerase [unclassified Pseudonocardia]ALE74916.1 maleate cis-trans isomerase [Pseudonocardia sp. EC080625-04]ALL74254.1 maleate cis-trans isomerase [Pseudonocardia sp. EC080610-09]ALL81277.1 maleate cis-trans isomerase [Pseudonocardia sp. EC080619-01]
MSTVGILYPGYSAEDDYPRAEKLLADGSRLPLVHSEMKVDAHREDALLDIGGDDVLAEAAGRVAAEAGPLDSVVWACTSGSFIFGPEGAARQAAALEKAAGVPASSTSFAFVDACKRLGVATVAVGATYPPDVAGAFVQFLTHHGISVLTVSARDIITAAEVGTLPSSTVLEFADAVSSDAPAADAVLLPDTALHTVEILDALDERLGKPVLTANQVSIWQGLRLAGSDVDRPRLGTLFRKG